MPLLVTALVVGLAAYRIARLLTLDTILKAPRMRFAMWVSARKPRSTPHPLADLATCPLCVSVWAAAGGTGWVWWIGYVHGWRTAMIVWWAAAGVAAILAQADLRLAR